MTARPKLGGTVAVPSTGGHTIVVEAEDWFSTVTVVDRSGAVVWGQCGSHGWALRCAADAVEHPDRYRRPWNPDGTARPERCECGGSGVLWGQTYGYASPGPRDVEVQRCDVCAVFAGDDDAARAAAAALVTAYRYEPAPGDDPGDWMVELPHGLVALRDEEGADALLDALRRTTVPGASDRG